MTSFGSKYVWGWLYCDGKVLNDSVVGPVYDGCTVYNKLFIDPKLFKLKIWR